eukprot:356375-Chlamydomonas_euryale.AAC.4
MYRSGVPGPSSGMHNGELMAFSYPPFALMGMAHNTLLCILGKLLFLQDLQSSHSNLGGNRVASICAAMLPAADSQHDLRACAVGDATKGQK